MARIAQEYSWTLCPNVHLVLRAGGAHLNHRTTNGGTHHTNWNLARWASNRSSQFRMGAHSHARRGPRYYTHGDLSLVHCTNHVLLHSNNHFTAVVHDLDWHSLLYINHSHSKLKFPTLFLDFFYIGYYKSWGRYLSSLEVWRQMANYYRRIRSGLLKFDMSACRPMACAYGTSAHDLFEHAHIISKMHITPSVIKV